MELIATKTATADGTSSITFSSIPQTYTDLKLVWTGRNSRNVYVACYTLVQFNGSTSNYTYKTLQAVGTGVASQDQTGTGVSTGFAIGFTSNDNNTANTFGSNELYIPNYTSSNYKSVSGDGVSEDNSATTGLLMTAGLWSDTAAITSITLTPSVGTTFDWINNSTFYLYGISNVTSGSKATGGIVSSDGTYNYHMFPFSGTFTPTTAISADVLVIAGGGGGGGGTYHASGGGAGGLLAFTSQSLTATGYTVTVGAGGAGGVGAAIGATGADSQFGSLTLVKGGGYGNYAPGGYGGGRNGGNGGSGGGGAGISGGGGSSAGGSPTSGQGYAGGGNTFTTGQFYYPGGGGGGAGGAGQNATNQAANGGIGLSYSTWANATQTGVNGYYAGGGGGSVYTGAGSTSGTQGGTGGLGGGGNGGNADTTAPTSGIANTGGGGGGAERYSSATGGSGGSGLVIIRYAI